MPMNQKLNKLELMNNNQSDLMMRAEMHKNIYIYIFYLFIVLIIITLDAIRDQLLPCFACK